MPVKCKRWGSPGYIRVIGILRHRQTLSENKALQDYIMEGKRYARIG